MYNGNVRELDFYTSLAIKIGACAIF